MMRIIVTLSAIFCGIASVTADDKITNTIQMEINVPNVEFYVLSQDGWSSNLQRFVWDAQRKNLKPILGLPIIMKNTLGGIKVTLKTGDKTAITSGVSEIYYRVEFLVDDYCAMYVENTNSTVECQLTSGPTNGEKSGKINLIPIKPATGWVTGDYTGVLSLIFEST